MGGFEGRKWYASHSLCPGLAPTYVGLAARCLMANVGLPVAGGHPHVLFPSQGIERRSPCKLKPVLITVSPAMVCRDG